MPMALHDQKSHLHLTSFVLTWGIWGCLWWCSLHHVILMPVQWHQMTKMSCCTSFWLSWCKEWNGVIFYAKTSASGISRLKNSCYTEQLQIRNTVVPLTTPLASHDANASAKCITWPKSHFAFCFNYLDKTDAVVLLIIYLAWDDLDAVGIDITWSEMPCCISFYHCHQTNGMAHHDSVGIMWYWDQHPWYYIKKPYVTLLQLIWPNEYNDAIDNVVRITWCWCQCQQWQMTERVILHLILFINWQMQWCYWWCH